MGRKLLLQPVEGDIIPQAGEVISMDDQGDIAISMMEDAGVADSGLESNSLQHLGVGIFSELACIPGAIHTPHLPSNDVGWQPISFGKRM